MKGHANEKGMDCIQKVLDWKGSESLSDKKEYMEGRGGGGDVPSWQALSKLEKYLVYGYRYFHTKNDLQRLWAPRTNGENKRKHFKRANFFGRYIFFE